MDKKEYRSYSRAVVAAVNDHFGRRRDISEDPYLETREKEDLFLERVMETIWNGLRRAALMPSALPMPAQPAAGTQADSEELSAALDFADSF